jgi:hypothetical protein
MSSGVTEKTYRVTAPHFCAGFVAVGHHVKEAAPILGWTLGKTIVAVLSYCHRKKWQVELLIVAPHP